MKDRAPAVSRGFVLVDVRVWPLADIPATLGDFCFRVKCGLNILAASISAHDPKRTFQRRRFDGRFQQRKNFIGLTAIEAAPPSRTVTLASGKDTREVALVDKAAELGNIGELPAWVL